MKADRKKAREELDIVHVVEWRANGSSTDRYFLMTRRPEQGTRLEVKLWYSITDVLF